MTYGYDAIGNRIERLYWNGSVTVDERFAQDGWDTSKPGAVDNENFDVVLDLNSTNGLVNRRLYGDGQDDLIAKQTVGGAVTWYLTDHLGSVQSLLDNSGISVGTLAYSAFGSTTTNVGATDRYQYTGREWDAALGLQFNRDRMYISSSGRWLSEDPSSFSAGDPNLMRYVGNGPTNGRDPSGLDVFVIKAAAFIPKRLGAKLSEPVPSTLNSLTVPTFNTNNRDFGESFKDSKIHAEASVDSDKIGSLTKEGLHAVADSSPSIRTRTVMTFGLSRTTFTPQILTSPVTDTKTSVPAFEYNVTNENQEEMSIGEYNNKIVERRAYAYATMMTNGNFCASGDHYYESYLKGHRIDKVSYADFFTELPGEAKPKQFDFLDGKKSKPNTDKVIAYSLSKVVLAVSGGYPFTPKALTPNIDFSAEVNFKKVGDTIDIVGTFTHRAFPDYELYIEQWRDGKLVKTHSLREDKTKYDGPGIINLGLLMVSTQFSITISLK